MEIDPNWNYNSHNHVDSWTPTQQNALQKQQDYPDFPADSDLDYIQRKYSQNDNYQKPVYELQVYNPMNHGQLDIPEGPLEPWIGEEEVLEMGNNYCNNNGEWLQEYSQARKIFKNIVFLNFLAKKNVKIIIVH